MSQSIQIPVTQIGLEQSIIRGVRNASKKANFSLGGLGSGGAAQKINAISQPLGRITGQADEFSKSMAAANARVLAFGASAGILAGVSVALSNIVKSAINVEQKLTEINTVLGESSSRLEKFGQNIFEIAKNTGQSFDVVAEGALELARQGLSATETLKRLNDALILSRLSGLDATKSVEGLTAAINSFSSSGETSSTVLNKLVVVSQKYAVSEKDLIEAIKRSASVADLAGVSLDNLIGVVTAVQQKTARGGAVIGNSFKTIFARILKKDVLTDLENLGVSVVDASQEILPATEILGNLASRFGELSKIQQTDLAKKLGGIYQLDKLLAGLKDLNSENSIAKQSAKESSEAQKEAYEKNLLLNQTLANVINKVTVNAQELAAKLGEIGVTDSLKNILSFFNTLLEGVRNLLGEESGLGKFVRGVVKGISDIITGPGLALFAAIIIKLSKDLVIFGAASLKSFFGIGKAAKDIKDLETSIKLALASNVDLQEKIFALEGNRYKQLRLITKEIADQEIKQRSLNDISSSLSSPAYRLGVRGTSEGLRVPPRLAGAAGGYIPAVTQERKSIQKGVGGARSGDKPVVVPNFSFGGGKKGTMVAHTGEYIVPNFAGSGGSAVFNRDMVRSMGLPEGAKKINAAGGFIPNFAAAKVPPIGAPVEEFVAYFKGQKETDSYAAIRNLPKYFESQEDPTLIGGKINKKFVDTNRIAGAIKTSLTRAPFKVDASRLEFPNGFGLGVVTLNKKTQSNTGTIKLDDNNLGRIGGKALIQEGFLEKKFKDELKKENINEEDVSKFREQFKQKLGLDENSLDLDAQLELDNIRVSDFTKLQGYGKEKQDQFQKRINTILAAPLARLSNDIFGGALGPIDESVMADKYLFGKDVLGNIYESAVNIYTKGAENLPPFAEGEAKRGGRFDFPLDDANQAKRLNEVFFPGDPIGRADAKYTAATSDLNEMVEKSLGDRQALAEIQKQIKLKGNMTAAKGFIPNFASIYDKFKVDPKAQGSLKVNNEKSTPFTAKKNIWDFVDNPEAKRKLLALSDSFDTTIGQNDFWFRGTNIKELKNLLSQGYSSSMGINDQTNSGSTFFASSFGKAASYGLRGPTGDKVDNGIVMILKKQFLQNKQFDQSPFEQEKENSIRLFGKYFKEDLEGVVDLRSGNFTGIDKLGIKNSAKGFIPNFSDTRTQLSGLISQFIDSGRTFPEVPLLNTSQNEQLRSRIQQIRLAGDFSRYRLIDSLSSDIESQVGTSTLNSLLSSLSSTVKSSLPPIDSTQISDSNNEKNIAEKSGSDLSLVGGKLKVGFLRSRDGNPLFEIAKKIKSREITSIDAGTIIGPRIPDLIVGLKNLVERMRLKDPSFPRIPIQGTFNPKYLAERINSKSFKKTQAQFPDRDLINNKSRYFKAGDDFFLPEDLKNLGKAYKTLGTAGRKNEYIRLEELFPQGLAEGYIPNFAKNKLITESGSSLSYYDDAKGFNNIEMLKSNKKGDGFNLFNQLMQQGRPIKSVTLEPQLNRPNKSVTGDPFYDTLLSLFPQLKYRMQSGLQTSGMLLVNGQRTKFPSLKELRKLVKGKDPSVLRDTDPDFISIFDPITKQIKGKGDSLASGYIPNFADPLKEAVGREMSAGVPASQIYVDKNSSLKNAMNPMGLMVANRRDEPAGGFQGINRARKEGADPMTYGAASGFVPNYAPDVRTRAFSGGYIPNFAISLTQMKNLRKMGGEVDRKNKDSYYYSNLDKKILLGRGEAPKEWKGEFSKFFIFLHELGHYLDNDKYENSFDRRTNKKIKNNLYSKKPSFLTKTSILTNEKRANLLAIQAMRKVGISKSDIQRYINFSRQAYETYMGRDFYVKPEEREFYDEKPYGKGRVGSLLKKPTDIPPQKLEVFEALRRKIQRVSNYSLNNAAGGTVPNFADPLKKAVGREMAAGVPASQIYVDKNSSLKNAMNPMGLMVANRRDEPAGGFQGINRARREGADPMMYGAASGFVPNFIARQTRSIAPAGASAQSDQSSQSGAIATATQAIAASVTGGLVTPFKQFKEDLEKLIESLNKDIKSGRKTNQEASAEVDKFTRDELKKTTLSEKSIDRATIKAQDQLVPDKAPKNMSDFIGKLFLVQTVMTGVATAMGEFGEVGKRAGEALQGIAAGAISANQFFGMFQMAQFNSVKNRKGSDLLNAVSSAKNDTDRSSALQALEQGIRDQVSGTPDIDSFTARTARRAARPSAARPTSPLLSRSGAVARGANLFNGTTTLLNRGLLPVLTKVGPLFARLIPIVGLLTTGFQIVSGILKTFGFDLNKYIGNSLIKLGKAFGLVKTDAEKLAESFAKNSKEVSANLVAGKVDRAGTGFGKTIQEQLDKANEKRIKDLLRDDKQKADKENLKVNFTQQTLNDLFIANNAELLQEKSGLTRREISERYRESGFENIQKDVIVGYGNGTMFSPITDAPQPTTPIMGKKGPSKPQLESLAALNTDITTQFGDEKILKSLNEAYEKKDLKAQKSLLEALSASANKNVQDSGKSQSLKDLQNLILTGGNLDDPKVIEKISKAEQELFKERKLSNEVEAQLNLINLELAKQKLDSLIKYKTALMDLPSILDTQLSIDKELINTTDARKLAIEREIAARKSALDLTKQQSEAAYNFIKDQGAISAIIQQAGLGEATEESFEKVAGIISQITDGIKLQGAYTEENSEKARAILKEGLGDTKASQNAANKIIDLLDVQLNSLADQQQVQLAIQDLELKTNSIIEARNYLIKMENDQRVDSLEYLKEELSTQEKLAEIQSKSFSNRANRLKEVAPKSMQFEIEALQNVRDRSSARASNENKQNTIFRTLQADLLKDALDNKFTDLAKSIENATKLDDLKNFGDKFAEAEKEAAIEKIKAAFEDKKSTINTAVAFRNIVVNAAEQLAKSLNASYQSLKEQIGNKVEEIAYATKSAPQEVPRLQGELKNLQAQQNSIPSGVFALKEIEEQKNAQIENIRSSQAFSDKIAQIRKAFSEAEIGGKEFTATLEELDFGLRASSIQIEKQFEKLMLSFSNDIAKQERDNIAIGGRIERLGMVRDFEIENRANYSNITDPQEYLKRQQSISAEYFQKIQNLELERANNELTMQFKTEQMSLENIKQLSFNTEALRQLKDQLLQDDEVVSALKNPEIVKEIESIAPELIKALRDNGTIAAAQGLPTSMTQYFDRPEVGAAKISEMAIAARKIASGGGDMEAASREAAEKIFGTSEGVEEFVKSILDLANRFKKGVAENKEAKKTFDLGQDLEDKRSKAGTFKEGVEEGFRDLNQRRADFALQIGREIPTMFADGMSQALSSAIEGAVSLKDALRSAAYEFVKGINQRLMGNLVDNVVGNLGNFGFGMFKSQAPVTAATGGMITGGSGNKDDVPAMLMGGEYVVNKKAVSKYGAPFLESLNNGTLMGYAKGGKVQRGPQGNFYTPGTFGQGAISGKRNLLDFATQTGTSGQFDQMINESGYQSVSLEPESSRLSVSGMRNSPMFDATQSAKGQAFDLYLQQYNAEREAKKAEKEQKKALTTQLLMLAGSAALGAVGNAAGAGAKASLANLSKDAGFLEKLGAAASGAFKGGDIGGGIMGGGLKNLFSGNLNLAFQSSKIPKALAISGSGYGAGTSFSGNVTTNEPLPTRNGFGSKRLVYENLGGGDQLYGRRSYLLDGRFSGNPLFRATGGMIPSASGIDTVPAMLSGGEFVMNRSAVQGIGAQNLQSMNSGGTSITSEETSKELNERLLAKLDELISSSGSTGNITINVAPSGQTTQETSQDPSASRQQLARQIKDAVLQIINDEKRIGGTLRR